MDSLSACFFLFLIVFIVLSTTGLNKGIAPFSFSFHFLVVLPVPRMHEIRISKIPSKYSQSIPVALPIDVISKLNILA